MGNDECGTLRTCGQVLSQRSLTVNVAVFYVILSLLPHSIQELCVPTRGQVRAGSS